MTRRRFTDKPEIDPTAVSSLSASHAAIVQNRTLYPSTVVEVTRDVPDRLLVSGRTNRKLGDTVIKGAFKGYALYGLSLEERATCPADCDARLFCFGNAMPFARRHKIGNEDVFFDRLGFEIIELLEEHPDGLLIRLHVLGDFPSVEYVAFWGDVLNENPKVAIYGYTHRKTTAWGGDEIGDAIEALKDAHPSRFRIRWSSEVSRPDGTVIVDFVPDRPRIDAGIVCPAQTDATACCASCGLCWDRSKDAETIVFIKHGRKSFDMIADAVMESPAEVTTPTPNGARPIVAVPMPPKMKPAAISSLPPEMRMVSPRDLLVEPAYQRDLTGNSIRLIRKIVSEWDWAKFKPPVCAETADGYFVIDGQHTAIAAATHPDINTIPVMVAQAQFVTERAGAFVAHNRDRLAMSVFQIFHAEVAAGAEEATKILQITERVGAMIPRSSLPRGKAKPGHVIAVNDIRSIYRRHGAEVLERVLRIAVMAEQAPLGSTVARGLRILLVEADAFGYVSKMPDSRIANGLKANPNIDEESRTAAIETDCGRDWCCAAIIADACEQPTQVAA